MLAKSLVHEGLVSYCTPGGIGLLEKEIEYVFIDANRNSSLAAGFRFLRNHPPALSA